MRNFLVGFILVAATVANLIDWRGIAMLAWEAGDGLYNGTRSFVNANKERSLPGVIVIEEEE